MGSGNEMAGSRGRRVARSDRGECHREANNTMRREIIDLGNYHITGSRRHIRSLNERSARQDPSDARSLGFA